MTLPLVLHSQIKSGGTLESPTAAFATAIHNANEYGIRFEPLQDLIPPTPAFSVPRVGPKLRPYQTDILREIWRLIEAGTRRLLLPLPTGGGKTVIAASLVAHAVSLGWRVLILAHRRPFADLALTQAQENFAHPDLQPEANLAIGAQAIGTFDWQMDMAKALKGIGGMQDPNQFAMQWQLTHPCRATSTRPKKRLGRCKVWRVRVSLLAIGMSAAINSTPLSSWARKVRKARKINAITGDGMRTFARSPAPMSGPILSTATAGD